LSQTWSGDTISLNYVFLYQNSAEAFRQRVCRCATEKVGLIVQQRIFYLFALLQQKSFNQHFAAEKFPQFFVAT
jgi:hypothetical protein